MDKIDNVLETVFSHKYGSIVLTMFLVFYSGLAAPKLPSFIRNLFENPIFRILILSLIVYKGNKDPQLAIMIAVGFTVTMNFISSQRFFENFSNHSGSPHSGDNQTTGDDGNNSSDDGNNSSDDGNNSSDNGTTNTSDSDEDPNNQGMNTTQNNNNQGNNNQGTNNPGTNDDPFDNTVDNQPDYMSN